MLLVRPEQESSRPPQLPGCVHSLDGNFGNPSGAEEGVAEFELITEMSDLKALAEDLQRADVIAFDTEADSFYHYFDKTCLLQISTRDQAWLVDPLALDLASVAVGLVPWSSVGLL